MSFSTMLDDKSASIVQHLLLRHIPGLQTKTSINAPPLAPGSGKHVLFDEFWLEVRLIYVPFPAMYC